MEAFGAAGCNLFLPSYIPFSQASAQKERLSSGVSGKLVDVLLVAVEELEQDD